jgi:hypothetical protein
VTAALGHADVGGTPELCERVSRELDPRSSGIPVRARPRYGIDHDADSCISRHRFRG